MKRMPPAQHMHTGGMTLPHFYSGQTNFTVEQHLVTVPGIILMLPSVSSRCRLVHLGLCGLSLLRPSWLWYVSSSLQFSVLPVSWWYGKFIDSISRLSYVLCASVLCTAQNQTVKSSWGTFGLYTDKGEQYFTELCECSWPRGIELGWATFASCFVVGCNSTLLSSVLNNLGNETASSPLGYCDVFVLWNPSWVFIL